MTRVQRIVQTLARLPQRLLMAVVQFYRLFLSAWLGSQCRFEPTCSRYALEALERHGAATGSYLAARRILRCSPWCEGGCDPVPDAAGPAHPTPGRAASLFSRLRSFPSSRMPSRTTTKP